MEVSHGSYWADYLVVYGSWGGIVNPRSIIVCLYVHLYVFYVNKNNMIFKAFPNILSVVCHSSFFYIDLLPPSPINTSHIFLIPPTYHLYTAIPSVKLPPPRPCYLLTFLVSVVTPDYRLTIKELELGTIDEREHDVFLLGYRLPHAIQ